MFDPFKSPTGLVTLLDRRYRAGVAAIEPLAADGGHGVFAVHRRRGPAWIVRVSPRERPFLRVLGDAAVLRFLARHRYPAERLVPSVDGDLATEFEGRGVLVTRRVSGCRARRSDADLEVLGELAGRLFALPETPPADVLLRRRAGSLPRQDLDHGLALLDSIAETVPADRVEEFERLQARLKATADCAALPEGLVHPDLQPGNILRQDDGRFVVVDWEGAGIGPRIASLGVLLYAAVVSAPGEEVVEGDIGRVDAVMMGFLRHAHLTHGELELLEDAVRFRPLVVAAREFAATVSRGVESAPSGWWSRHDLSATIADRARDIAGRRRRTPPRPALVRPEKPPKLSDAEVFQCLRRLLGDRESFAFERSTSGVSTPVYRIRRAEETMYLRIAEAVEADLGPELHVHELLLAAAAKVPPVLDYVPLDPDVGRSVALLGSIAGEAVGWSPTLSGPELDSVLRAAGEDLARVNAVTVEGWGWIRRDLGRDRLVGENSSLVDWLFSAREEDVHGCLRTVTDFVSLPEAAGVLARLDQFVSSPPEPVLAHGDFDVTHIFHVDGRYSGLIDFGEIRGAEPWYDAALFHALHVGYPLGRRMLGAVLGGRFGLLGVDEERMLVTAWLNRLRFVARHLRRRGSGAVELPAIRSSLDYLHALTARLGRRPPSRALIGRTGSDEALVTTAGAVSELLGHGPDGGRIRSSPSPAPGSTASWRAPDRRCW